MKDTKDQIILVGDIHGEFPRLNYDIKRYGYTDAYIIQCGDTGFGFHHPNEEKKLIKPLQETLFKNNLHLYMIRGNHCNPSYFSQTNNPFDFSNITLLSDYSELNLLGKSILLIGGAVSVDRRFRHEGKTWWSDENFNLKLEDQFPYKDREYDLVVTHTRPSVCGAFKGFDNIKYWCDQDPDLINDLIIESQSMDKLWEWTKPKWFCYGHFHKSLTTQYENTTFKCLGIHEHYQYFVLTSPDSSI
jgi:DNA repair exonuclease SbcCD nuclease subunit